MDVLTLQNKLQTCPELIEIVLQKLGHEHIKDQGKYYSFCSLGGDNINGCSLIKENLVYSGWSHGKRGSIFSLVMEEKGCSFPRALDLIASWIGIKKEERIVIKHPFNYFYKDIVKNSYGISSLQTYSESELPPQNRLSKLWLDDGVDLLTQEEFGIRLDLESNRIIIPEHNTEGKLIGAKARVNDKNCPLDQRWSMYIPFSKSQVCYGYVQNYKYIQEKNTVIILESEKGVNQACSFGIRCCLAIGGHDISETQANIIRSLMVKNIILAFDEGICNEEVIWNAKKLISNIRLFSSNVFIIDMENQDLIPKGSKDSITDNGYKIFKQMIINHKIKIGE